MPKSWSAKRERQAENIKEGSESRGATERGRTYQELYDEAREKGLKGRSNMSKAELRQKLTH